MSMKQRKTQQQEHDRDHYTGYLTTGHDWNGIKELNTKVPRLLLVCLAMAFLFSLVYWYLMPAWPLGKDYTRGKLGVDQKAEINEQLRNAALSKLEWSELIESSSFEAILADPQLIEIVQDNGPALYADNCAMCHGQKGEGNLYFPQLTDEHWLWGGSPKQIHQTISVGINAAIEGTRIAQMPAFGTTGVLDSTAISDVVLYVQSLSTEQVGDGSRAEELLSIGRGQALFKNYCAACHGAQATGNHALGAPNLTDKFWIYGSDNESITHTLNSGRSGVMPAWKYRMSTVDLRIISLYVYGMADKLDSGIKDEE